MNKAEYDKEYQRLIAKRKVKINVLQQNDEE
jgi:hypothetical protein